MAIVTENLSESLFPQFASFVNEAYGPGHFLADLAFCRWNFTGVDGPDAPMAALITRRDDEVLGFMGAVPIRFDFHDGPVSGAWLVNMMAREAYRGLMLGVRLTQAFASRYPMLMAIGYNELSGPVLNHLGWQSFSNSCMRRSALFLDPGLIVHLPHAKGPMLEALSAARPVLGAPEAAVEAKELSPSAVDALWERVRGRYGIAAARNHAFVDWRFLRYPRAKYRIYCDDARVPAAMAVVRLEKWRHPEVARLVDLWGEGEAVAGLLPAVLGRLHRDGAKLVDFFVNRTPDQAVLDHCGFVPMPDEQANDIPYLFNPVERIPRYMENIIIHNQRYDYGLDDYYFTRADCDRDRPT